jgi:GTP-binding protein LepA
LGFGFRCGFLGLLHLEIIQERLTREYDLDLITTAPSVVYKIHLTKAAGEAAARTIELHNPADMPDPNRIASIEEPWIEATIYVPDDYLGPILKLCQDRRGIQKNLTYVAGRAQLTYELPLNEVVFDFYDRLKSISRGYASFDYHQIGHREGDLVKMSILVNNEPVDAFEHDRPPRHRRSARPRHVRAPEGPHPPPPLQDPHPGRDRRQGHRRETIAALRKDVTAKCYGGDASRKKKLLEKQKEGKKRMREYGSVSIPQEAFIAALRMGEE